MTSKEALSDLSFLAIGDENHTIKCKETIEKDLEVLEILKKHIYSSDSSISIILDDLRNYDDFKKVKEWLDNDN